MIIQVETEKSEIPVEEEESDIQINDLDNNRLPRIDGIFLPIEPKDFNHPILLRVWKDVGKVGHLEELQVFVLAMRLRNMFHDPHSFH